MPAHASKDTQTLIRREVPVRGGYLSVRESGSGTAILFLHGFSLDQSMWQAQVRHLGQRFRTITFDLRGFGESSSQLADAHHDDDLLTILDALQIEAADLVGLSLGANVALALAIRCPERVRHLVLTSPGLPGHAWKTPRPPDELAAFARAHGAEAAMKRWRNHELFASIRSKPDAWEIVDSMIGRFSPAVWRGEPVAPALADVTGELAGVVVPTLVINGESDLAGYLEVGERIAREVPNAKRLLLEGAGHLVNIEQPAKFNSATSEFLTIRPP